ncbi:Exonuclease VII, large subunit [Thermodesulfatator indicus DSM 15286]|uniref:Exonuclease VII, large subunit n=2 Tax=Thermodesulfatator indicus TaxID=171695 RepID=F8ACM5_THEID|nr:Exonuclease VII, large subunit [Thermodesulfatator indicus DSM 15286]
MENNFYPDTNNGELYRYFDSVEELYNFVDSCFHSLTEKFKEPYLNQIKIRGTVRLSRKQKGKYYYFGKLFSEEGSTIDIWIPPRLVEDIFKNDIEEFESDTYILGTINLKVDAYSLKPIIKVNFLDLIQKADEEFLETQKKEINLIELWKRFPHYKRLFPDDISITVIRPLVDTAYQDFEGKLESVREFIKNYRTIPVKIDSAEEIVQAINEAQGTVLVMLRGGGEDVQFEVFNDLRVVEAWAAKESFKILGLGHTENRGYLIEIFSDVVTTTPTEAGNYIALEIQRRRQEKAAEELRGKLVALEKEKEEREKERQRLVQEMNETRQELAKHKGENEELKRKIREKETNLKEKEEQIRRLNREISENREKLGRLEAEKRLKEEELEKFMKDYEKEKTELKDIYLKNNKETKRKVIFYGFILTFIAFIAGILLGISIK